MSKKIYFFLLIVPLFLAGCSQTPSRSVANENTNSNVSLAAKPGQVAVLNSNIIVSKPLSNALVSSPLAVAGQVIASSALVSFKLKDKWNSIIATSSVILNSKEKAWQDYQVDLAFQPPLSPQGVLQVYIASNKEGDSRNLITIPLVFKEYKKPAVKVYFSNIIKDPELKNCKQVYPAERILEPTNQIPTAALTELLKGTTEEEMKAGFVTNLPEKEKGVKIQKFEIKDNKAYVDFNQALQEGVSGLCRVNAIHAQITETLKQFSEIKEVVISIDGKTTGILKP